MENTLMLTRACSAFLFALLLPSAAGAQSTTVTVSLIGNLVRTYSSDSSVTGFDSFSGASTDGESMGIAVRVARSLGDRWGVELEVGLPAAVETDTSGNPFAGSETSFVFTTITIGDPSSPSFPTTLPRDIRTTTESTYTTLNPALWFRQPVGSRMTLAYSAGPSFIRRRIEYERVRTYVVLPGSGTPLGSVVVPPGPITLRDEFTDYGIGVAVGFEAEIRLTERLAAVPGVRLQSAEGWIVRPGVGVSWRF